MDRFVSLLLLAQLAACQPKLTDEGPAPDEEGDDDDDDDDGDDDDDDDDDNGVPYIAHLVDEVSAPRFATVADLDDDGTPELLVSSLGVVTQADVPPGVLSLYRMDGGLDEWVRTDLVNLGDGIRYPGAPLAADVDDDGDLDVVLPSGGLLCEPLPEVDACGALHWLENRGGDDWPLREVVTGSLAFFTSAQLGDLDDNGTQDLVVVGERFTVAAQGAVLMVFPGTGNGNFQALPVPLAIGGGPWPSLEDIDEDGDLDVMMGEPYTDDSFAWYENRNNEWLRHIIADNLGNGYMIRRVDGLVGDAGERWVVATNHTNTLSPYEPDTVEAQVIAMRIPNDPTQEWTDRQVLSEGIQANPDTPILPLDAPGEFAPGDVDDDGDLDLAVAGSGDPRVFLLEQTEPGEFATRVLATGVPRSGGIATADFDGDGDIEIVTVSEGDDMVYVIEQE